MVGKRIGRMEGSMGKILDYHKIEFPSAYFAG